MPVARRARDYVSVRGPTRKTFCSGCCRTTFPPESRALLLTPKARVIAPLVVWRCRGRLPAPDRARAGRTCRDAPSREVRGQGRDRAGGAHVGRRLRRGRRHPERGLGEPAPSCSTPTLRRRFRPTRSSASGSSLRPGLGQGARRHDPSRRGGARRDARLVHERLLSGPGTDRALHYRGKANRGLRVLEVESAQPGDDIRQGDKVVGRITSAVADRALGYVRVEVPDDADLAVGANGKTARTLPA